MINLLIVDDEINIGTGIRDNIDWEEYGIRVCGIAENGVQAMDLLIAALPDILIMDIYMPEMSGLELLEIVNEKYPNIKTILISGFREFEYARQAVNLNAFAFISKPIDDQELLRAVIKARDGIQARREKLQRDAVVTARIKQNLSVLRDNFLSGLVKGRYKKMDQLAAQALSYEINLDAKQYLVGLVVQDTIEKEKIPDGGMDESLYRAVVFSGLDVLLHNNGYYFFHLENGIGMLFADDRIDRNDLHKQLDSLIKWVNQEGGFRITIALGKTCERMEDIPLSYRTAVSALDYKIVMGNNQVMDSENISGELLDGGCHIRFYQYLRDVEKPLLVILKSGNTEALGQWVEEAGEELRRMIQANIHERSNALFVLAFYLYSVQSELNIYGDHIPHDGSRIFFEMRKLSDLSEVKNYIRHFLNNLIADIRSRDNDHRNYLVDRAKDYILQNVHEQISLVTVADYLGIHPSYLSKIFRMATGETFTDFVAAVKMGEAERLLKSSNLHIYEISGLLKFNDPGYFIKLFRKVYGVSPNEYRQLEI